MTKHPSSLCTGLGSSILSISLVIILSDQSGEAFAVFYGIGTSGYAIGVALVPPIADYLMRIYGWRGSLMIIGGIMAHLIPFVLMVDLDVEGVVRNDFGPFNTDDEEIEDQFDRSEIEALISRPSFQEETHNDGDKSHVGGIYAEINPANNEIGSENENARLSDIQEVTSEKSATGKRMHNMLEKGYKRKCLNDCSNCYRIFTDSIYNQDRWMVLLMLVTLVLHMVDSSWYAYLIPCAIALDIPISQVLCLPYSAGAGLFVARILGGFLEKSKLLSGQSLFLFFTLLNILSLLWNIFAPRFAFMIVTSFISAFTISQRNLLSLVICKDRVPTSQFPMILASYEIVCGIGLFLGSLLCGYVADVTGSFNASYMFIAGVEILVSCLMIPSIIAEKLKERTAD
nr:monocarboxylate transporter 12-like [Lytechinus pictus]